MAAAAPAPFGSATEEAGYRAEIARRQRKAGAAKAAADWEAESGDGEGDGSAPSSPSSPPSSPGSGTRAAGSIAGEGAGAILALMLYPLLVALLNGGPAEMWGWVAAKWTNKPYGGQTTAGPTPATGSTTPAPTPTGTYYNPWNNYIK